MHRIIGFQRRLVESGAFSNPRSHIYYLPELYSAYFGRCHAAFMALPPAARRAIDPDGTFEFIRVRVLAYVEGELIAREMNPFDAALALMALAHLGADVKRSRRRCTSLSPASARAEGTRRTRPMNGTR